MIGYSVIIGAVGHCHDVRLSVFFFLQKEVNIFP